MAAASLAIFIVYLVASRQPGSPALPLAVCSSGVSMPRLIESYSQVLEELRAPGLHRARRISICVSKSIQVGDLAPLLEALVAFKHLEAFVVTQYPDPTNDEATTTLFHAIASSAHFTSLLSRCLVFLCGVYVAGHMGKRWVHTNLDADYLPRKAFPVQQMLVSYRSRNNLACTLYKSYNLDDGLLQPDRFSSGLITFLQAHGPDPRPYSFC